MPKKKSAGRKWTAKELLALLEAKHEKDVFVPECKDGPTWGTSHMRMDAWAMRRSWSRPCVWAYEIKVSRSDFTGDRKYQGVYQCCNEFYWVCPPGLIRPEEVDDAAGLLWGSMSGSKLFTKKKAKYRPDVEIPDCLYRYLLMNRCRITGPRLSHYEEEPKIEYWKRWLREKAESRRIGYAVGRKLREMYEKDVEQVRYRQTELAREIKGLKNLRAVVKRLKLSPWTLDDQAMIARRLKTVRQAVPEELVTRMEGLIASMEQGLSWLKHHRESTEEQD